MAVGLAPALTFALALSSALALPLTLPAPTATSPGRLRARLLPHGGHGPRLQGPRHAAGPPRVPPRVAPRDPARLGRHAHAGRLGLLRPARGRRLRRAREDARDAAGSSPDLPPISPDLARSRPIAPDRARPRPTSPDLAMLQALCSEPKNHLMILSGLGRDKVQRAFGAVPHLSLAVEHGFHFRIKDGPWQQLKPGVDVSWKEVAIAIMKVAPRRPSPPLAAPRLPSPALHLRRLSSPPGLLAADERLVRAEQGRLDRVEPPARRPRVRHDAGARAAVPPAGRARSLPRRGARGQGLRGGVPQGDQQGRDGRADGRARAGATAPDLPPTSPDLARSRPISRLVALAQAAHQQHSPPKRRPAPPSAPPAEPLDFVLCIGDDSSDELMFQVRCSPPPP